MWSFEGPDGVGCRIRRSTRWLIVPATLWLADEASAQERNDAMCLEQFSAAWRAASSAPVPLTTTSGACENVATVLMEHLAGARHAAFNRDEQARREREAVQTTRGETSSAPGEATATIEPVESAGGSFGAFASEGGSGSVTTLAINPAFFVVSPKDARALARWGRFSDFSLIVPTSDADRDNDGDVDYIGFRWRVNINGLAAGEELLSAVSAAFTKVLEQGTEEQAAIKALLDNVDDDEYRACVEAVLRAGRAGLTPEELERGLSAAGTACGGTPIDIAASKEPYVALDEAIQAARIAADSRYFGLDLRADFGDLERFAIDTIAGRTLTVGIGLGRRFTALDNETSTGFRFNLGVRFVDPKGTTRAGFSATGGASFEMTRYYDNQRLSLNGGLEFQADVQGDSDGATTNDYLAFRGSLNIPLAGTTSATVTFGTPIAGGTGMGPTLSVKANWRLLFAR